MGVGTFAALSLGVIAVIFIEDLGISRAQLGFAFAVNTAGAAILSPFVGRLTDRIGGRASLIVVALASATAFLLLGVASSFGVLVAASAIGGLAQSNANPATNKLIAEDLPAGSQGIVTGIKQSGVQAFVFLGGAIVPAMALAWGRWSAYLLFAIFAVVLAGIAWFFLPRSARHDDVAWTRDSSRLPSDIWWITAYGFLLGFGGSVTVLYALFTTERLGRSVLVGGAVVAVVGITAMPARIAWAHYAERRHAYRRSLIIIALLAVGGSVALIASASGPWWLVWVAAVLTGIGPSSWNSVGMLGLIVFAGPTAAGRASGVVLAGFLIGLGAGPPVFGWMVDVSGDYNGVWYVSLVAFAAGLLTVMLWSPQERSSSLSG
jgi:MFS family permease